MKAKLRVVFDTNIFISAIIFGGNPRQCLELARSGDIKLFTSKAILLEITRNLGKFDWNSQEVRDVIEGLGKFTTVVAPEGKINLIYKHPKDNIILECALEAEADYIVSGDKKHLLSLEKFKGIPVITAKQFLELHD